MGLIVSDEFKQSLKQFFIVNDSGYFTLEHFAKEAEGEPVDGELLCFIDAGDTLWKLVEAAMEFTNNKD